ncbi:hypothetical protein RFI_11813 [Reticulomyxa filosa]|uniref:Uncharacterized protein n=1 Tax=Reticulomyxa filosa TaxID=46433 RepID=X6NJ00_RETFI|nr:hypothetical protein RFI_11813 [Reticulomyxa filosa]|eukprot:ETO25327.1 hypothetical protein RFI_11813 [Reticulomyxa filosa]
MCNELGSLDFKLLLEGKEHMGTANCKVIMSSKNGYILVLIPSTSTLLSMHMQECISYLTSNSSNERSAMHDLCTVLKAHPSLGGYHTNLLHPYEHLHLSTDEKHLFLWNAFYLSYFYVSSFFQFTNPTPIWTIETETESKRWSASISVNRTDTILYGITHTKESESGSVKFYQLRKKEGQKKDNNNDGDDNDGVPVHVGELSLREKGLQLHQVLASPWIEDLYLLLCSNGDALLYSNDLDAMRASSSRPLLALTPKHKSTHSISQSPSLLACRGLLAHVQEASLLCAKWIPTNELVFVYSDLAAIENQSFKQTKNKVFLYTYIYKSKKVGVHVSIWDMKEVEKETIVLQSNPLCDYLCKTTSNDHYDYEYDYDENKDSVDVLG